MVEALAFKLRISPAAVFQERQQVRVGYGQYAALKGVSYLGRGSLQRIVSDYERDRSWSDIALNNGSRLGELVSWMGDLIRATQVIERQLRSQPPRSRYRAR